MRKSPYAIRSTHSTAHVIRHNITVHKQEDIHQGRLRSRLYSAESIRCWWMASVVPRNIIGNPVFKRLFRLHKASHETSLARGSTLSPQRHEIHPCSYYILKSKFLFTTVYVTVIDAHFGREEALMSQYRWVDAVWHPPNRAQQDHIIRSADRTYKNVGKLLLQKIRTLTISLQNLCEL